MGIRLTLAQILKSYLERWANMLDTWYTYFLCAACHHSVAPKGLPVSVSKNGKQPFRQSIVYSLRFRAESSSFSSRHAISLSPNGGNQNPRPEGMLMFVYVIVFLCMCLCGFVPPQRRRLAAIKAVTWQLYLWLSRQTIVPIWQCKKQSFQTRAWLTTYSSGSDGSEAGKLTILGAGKLIATVFSSVSNFFSGFNIITLWHRNNFF